MSEYISYSPLVPALEEVPGEYGAYGIDLRKDFVVRAEDRYDIEDPQGLNHAPTRDARALLDMPINRPHMNFEMRFAQTPLGPEKLFTHARPYAKVLMSIAHARLGEVFAATGLDDPRFGRYASAIQEEVVTEYMRRFAGNTAAYKSLREEILKDEDAPVRVGKRAATLIWRARTGGASVRDTGELLLLYPRMRAIEAAKYTQPLDLTAPAVVQAHVDNGLRDCSQDKRLDLEIYDGSETGKAKRQSRRIDVLSSLEKNDSNNEEIEAQRRSLGIAMDHNSRETEETAKAVEEARNRRAHIFATKSNQAEMSDGTTLIQLVCKQSWIILPEHIGIDYEREGGLIPHKVMLPGMSMPVDLQPIGTSYYWRVLPVSHR